MRAFLAWLPVVCLSIAGCDANFNSIYRSSTFDGDEAQLVLIDAKQRSILSAEVPAEVKVTRASDAFGTIPDKNETEIVAIRRFCAEPSPDVFSVIAQSFSGGLNFGQAADPKTIEVALRAAFSSAESGSTIPRTQTINMLRELMFRTCERYLSGGYDELELSVQAVRDQRLIVSILAIEQLTGTVTPPTVIIAASGSGGVGSTGEAIVRLDDAAKARDAAESVRVRASVKYESENTKGTDGIGVCDQLISMTEDSVPTGKKEKYATCMAAHNDKEKSEEKFEQANNRYKELSALADSGGADAVTSTSSELTQIQKFSSIDSNGISVVAQAVRSIVERNIDDNSETLLFCMKVLGEVGKNIDQRDQSGLTPLRSECANFLKKSIDADALQLEDRIYRSRLQIDKFTDDAFEKFWTPKREEYFKTPSNRSDFSNKLHRLSGEKEQVTDCFKKSPEKEANRACFHSLEPDSQDWAIGIE